MPCDLSGLDGCPYWQQLGVSPGAVELDEELGMLWDLYWLGYWLKDWRVVLEFCLPSTISPPECLEGLATIAESIEKLKSEEEKLRAATAQAYHRSR